MIILVNAVTINTNTSKNFVKYIQYFLTNIITSNQVFKFIFLINDNNVLSMAHFPNVTFITINYRYQKVYTLYFNSYLLPKLVRESSANIVFHINYFHTIKNIKQCFFIANNNHLQRLKSAKAINSILIVNFNSVDKTTNNALAKNFIYLTPFIPLHFNFNNIEKQQIIDGYADGRNYFLWTNENANESNIVIVLKAFSHFKKWQKSNMKLIVIDEWVQNHTTTFNTLLQTYKYRDDVVVIYDKDETNLYKLAYSSYAVIYTPLANEIPTFLLTLIQLQCAIICGNNNTIQHYGSNSILLVNTTNYENIGSEMLQLFKNENRRNSLIEKSILLTKYHMSNHNLQQDFEKIINSN